MSMSRFSEYMARRGAGKPVGSILDAARPVTFFRDRFTTTKAEETVSLRDLVERVRDTRADRKDLLPWLKLARFGANRTEKGSLRHDANVLEIHGIEADYDGEQITLDRARQVLTNAGVAAMLYTSPSHREEAPRWRVLCPTSQGLPPASRAGLVARINGLFVGALAAESFTLSQSYYFGAVDGCTAHEVVLIEGRAIDLADELDDNALGRPAKPEPVQAPPPVLAHSAPRDDGGTILGRTALAERCDQIRSAWDGAKHRTINECAFAVGGLVSAGHLDEGVAWTELRAALGDILPRCKDKGAAERTLRRAFQEGVGRPQTVEPRMEDMPLAPAVHTITQQLIARAAAAKKAAAPPPLAVAPDLMDLPGALGLFVDHCNRTAMSPQPFLALAAGICMIGALAGRRYRTTTDLRTNIYAVGVADSGAGKDHARRQIVKCLFAADLAQYLGGSDIASGAGLRSALLRHPAMLFQIDEFGDWLRDVLGEKASTHRKQIASMLKELYSSANGPWQGVEYADQSKDKGKPRQDIHHPNACLYGTSTPGQFWSAVGGANLHDGLMARMLLFVTPCSYPDEQEPALAEPGADLIEALQAIATGAQGGGGNLAGLMLAGTAPQPYTAPETPAATEARKALRKDQLAQQRLAEGTYVTSIAGRLAENAMKLALIRAVSRNPAAPVIEAEDVAWGRGVAQHCMDTLLREANRYVADNDYEAKLNRAVEIVRKHGPLTERDMIRRGFKLPERERGEILRTLVEGGLIVATATQHGGPGRPTIRYEAGGANDTIHSGRHSVTA
ncbi:MAG: DUF3987 domain-containing protein [Roseomonas sp.]|nr:DUF3987 domain-containing protein [Roseomonas sp.]